MFADRLFTSTSYTIPLHTLGPVSVTFSPARDLSIGPHPSAAPGLDACVLTSRFWAKSTGPDATAVTY